MKTKLSAITKQSATNAFVTPVITYIMSMLKLTSRVLDDLNRIVRVTFMKHPAHHPKACKERFHVHSNQGGRDITDLCRHRRQKIDLLRSYGHERYH